MAKCRQCGSHPNSKEHRVCKKASLTQVPEDEQDPPSLAPRTPTPAEQDHPTPVVTGLLGIIYYVIIDFTVFLYPIAFLVKRVQVVTLYDIYRRPLNWLSVIQVGPRCSFMKYLVLGLAILGSWYSLQGSLPPYLPNLSSSRMDVYWAPEPAARIVKLAERLRRMESAVSSLSAADSDRTSGRDYSKLLDRLSATEERILELKKALAARKTFSTPTAPGPTSWWNKLLTKLRLSDGQDITALIRHLVDSAVSTFSQDIIAKPDFALHSGGAWVIGSLTSPTFEIQPQGLGSKMLGLITGNKNKYGIGRPPITALHHELQNGHCWPFAGGEGQLGVALSSPIFVEEVTIDHVAKSIAFDMGSAPRQMEVWGLVEGKDNIARVRGWKEDLAARKEARQQPTDDEVEYLKTLPKHYIRLANFTYNIHSPNNVQTFPVMPEIRELKVDFGILVLRVLNNWGRVDFTCLYRFRVHGQAPSFSG